MRGASGPRSMPCGAASTFASVRPSGRARSDHPGPGAQRSPRCGPYAAQLGHQRVHGSAEWEAGSRSVRSTRERAHDPSSASTGTSVPALEASHRAAAASSTPARLPPRANTGAPARHVAHCELRTARRSAAAERRRRCGAITQ
jgi:hypothetical protein